MMDEKDIETATYEAIYWWNHSESYYHRYFSRILELKNDKGLFAFFKSHVFEFFLREYSVRRNLDKGDESIDLFLDAISAAKFVERVNANERAVIDDISDDFSKQEFSKKRQTRSLLSKIAFLINPKSFSIYDSLAKKSIWQLIKDKKICRKKDLEQYSTFIGQTDRLISENEGLLIGQIRILEKFNGSKAQDFFGDKPHAFKRRVFDKYLWLMAQSENDKARPISSHRYYDFYYL
jgi:hypothetical protein